MNKLFKTLEIIWLSISIIGIMLTTYFTIKGDKSQALYFFVLTAVGGLMYSVRKKQRIRNENNNKQ